ncbi:unnamed protein product [Trichogramma brassicae]|uniref:Helicase SKI2W n=1 Tax=Trichogramma brassicae TaxID=86971 RepID=A0A6H5J886_9HYME|nr:unnamed protein product [Trichogramma brassicae]
MHQMPFGPPPILIGIKEELKEYIVHPEKLPIHQLDKVQQYWNRTPNISTLLKSDLAPIGTTLKYERDPFTGSIGQIQEVTIQNIGETVRNSMSMSRAPGPVIENVKGNASNYLFWPGGFEKLQIVEKKVNVDFENNLKISAKGFSGGIEFMSDNITPETHETNEIQKQKLQYHIDNINLLPEIDKEKKYLDFWSHPSHDDECKNNFNKDENKLKIEMPNIDAYIEPIKQTEIPILRISDTPNKIANKKTKWAEQIDVTIPVTDFDKKITNPALIFPYELDTFQKQAILKLEEQRDVFVAAHTSAGKTTIAEYAIAMSQKHMTRTIYTSPIKALSNQKFREFKEKFENVGLITGDLQINPTASCLIMTTEILQSMLYCAAEVLRDVEYVVFDEVHYINNEEDKLPVVVFTLSRNKCDKTVDAFTESLLSHQDQMYVKEFFKKSTKHLKGTDSQLPQVIKMHKLLKLGIGVHHSGILPILKEIVEMLFQKGIVKVLFATETFAMGVNMPAKTVVFESTEKYDGNSFRNLLPTEYIQMAGRAGRRGHDDTGTVIILCKKKVPYEKDLRDMTLGAPQNLISKFKVTYSMVLHLKRLSEAISIGDMMRRSFKEVRTLSSQEKNKAELDKIIQLIEDVPPLAENQKMLESFYEVAINFLQEWSDLRPYMLESAKAVKALVEGRILIIAHKHHYNKLGIFLGFQKKTKVTLYSVLVLTSVDEEQDAIVNQKSDKWHNIMYLSKTMYYQPKDNSIHEILTVPASSIIEVTNHTVNVNVKLILSDWEKRQIPRFKDAPPGPSCQTAAEELKKLSHEVQHNPNLLQPFLDLRLITLKGRVALEMGTYEILITELVLDNIITNWEPEEIASMLSSLLKKEIDKVYKRLVEIERKHYLEPIPQPSFQLVRVVYEWARAKSFAKIMELTDIQEGIIVRCIQQLNEKLQDVRNAAIIIGHPALKEKMEEASTKIKRDIVFTASLYIQD